VLKRSLGGARELVVLVRGEQGRLYTGISKGGPTIALELGKKSEQTKGERMKGKRKDIKKRNVLKVLEGSRNVRKGSV